MSRRVFWINKLRATTKVGSGVTHRMLGVPKSQKLPFTLLEAIRTTPIGSYVRNPTQVGKTRIKVTPLLKKRAVLALNLKRAGK